MGRNRHIDPLTAEEPEPEYFEFDPEDPSEGVYDNPHIGEVVPGRVYEVRAHLAHLFAGHPDWKKGTQKKYREQPPLEADRARLAEPAQPDDEEE